MNNKDKQYAGRDSVEIMSISRDVGDAHIEDECIKILKSAKVKVGNKFPSTLGIQAARRKRNKGKVIVKFVNRKFASAAISNRSNLKGIDDFTNIYINSSLCPEFSFLDFAVRKAKKNKEIYSFRIKNGITLFQKDPSS